MKHILLFHLDDCPYCHYARRAIGELKGEDARYGEIDVEWIEESRRPDVAAQYDYYYVPTIFYGKRKLYEARPGESYAECKRNVRAAFDAVLSE